MGMKRVIALVADRLMVWPGPAGPSVESGESLNGTSLLEKKWPPGYFFFSVSTHLSL